MNWRAGMFRIWVILSALWIGAWGYYGFTEWQGAKYEITDPTGLKFQIRGPRNLSEADAVAFVQHNDTVKKRQADCSQPRAPWCEFAFVVPDEMPNEFNMSIIWTAMAGPFILLLIGLIWSWVASGFRQTTVKP
jgi:hypothetical protein